MSLQESNKRVAIVTGAGQGIGFEICRRLAEGGVSVLLNDKDPGLAEKAAEKIRQEWNGAEGIGKRQDGAEGGGKTRDAMEEIGKGREGAERNWLGCHGVGGDAADPAVIQGMIDLAVEKFGGVDIVIANAGITLFGAFLTYPREAFDQVMRTNLGGSFFLAQAAANQMIRQGRGGRIVFMSSVTGHQAHKNLAAYSMTKAALEMLAKNLVVELSSFGITVNAIAPGATLTERTEEDDQYAKTWSSITPLGRAATTGDIAAAAFFLVSPQAGHITGQTLVIDGGWTSVSPSPYGEE